MTSTYSYAVSDGTIRVDGSTLKSSETKVENSSFEAFWLNLVAGLEKKVNNNCLEA